MEEEIEKLSKKIVYYSLNLHEGERVLITYQTPEPTPLVLELIKEISKIKAIPFTKMIDTKVESYLKENTKEKRIETLKKIGQFEIDNYDAFISIVYTTNDYESSKIKKETNTQIGLALLDIDDVRINKRKWVLLNYPSLLDAYKAKMKTEEYKEYAFNAMNYNYDKMNEDLKPLKNLMEKTDNVRIIGPNTDLTFSIKDMPIIPCCGKCNIPDGEIYTAPIKESVNGMITYNTPSPYRGNTYNNICLKFEQGKIIEATCDYDNEKLNDIFDTDEGSRYVGEFSLGINPMITKPIGDILYDEKIIGSLHFTPGRAYNDADNGNKSAVHWDLVLIQREEYGGGEIYFDHTLIRKDGKFVLDELKHLNYDIKKV